jgi:hypothetical protein
MERETKREFRLIDFGDLQLKANKTVFRKIGSQILADRVTKRPYNLNSINPARFISLNSNNSQNERGYYGFSQEGTFQIPNPNKKGPKTTRIWKTDAIYYTDGGWEIKTNYGKGCFDASYTPGGEVEINVTLPLSESFRLLKDRKKANKQQRYMDEHVFLYLAELRSGKSGNINEEMISITFSSIPGKSQIHLPIE